MKQNLPPLLNLVRYFNPANIEDAAKRAETLATAARERTQSATREMIRREMGWIASLFQDALTGGPLDETRAKALVQVAVVFGTAAQWDEAESTLAQAIPGLKDNDLVQAMLSRTEVLANLKRTEEALAQAQETVKLAPRSLSVRWSLAKRLAEAGRRAEARLEYMSLLREVQTNSPMGQQIREEFERLEKKPATGARP
jgi:tetratricopeptide (TPR) repeat protein